MNPINTMVTGVVVKERCNFYELLFTRFIFYFQAADLVDGKSETYTKFAEDQMAYSLGGNGQR